MGNIPHTSHRILEYILRKPKSDFHFLTFQRLYRCCFRVRCPIWGNANKENFRELNPKKWCHVQCTRFNIFSTHYTGKRSPVFLHSVMLSSCKICSAWIRKTACGTLPCLILKGTPESCHFDIKHGLNHKIMRFHSKGYETTVYSSENA